MFSLGEEAGESERRKVSYVSRESVCKPKEARGLGIKNITLFNETFLTKWR